MLRKIAHIVFALFLMIMTSGISVSVHYCGGSLVSATLNEEAKSCCGSRCGSCETRTVLIEIEDDYVAPLQAEIPFVVLMDLFVPVLNILQNEFPVDGSYSKYVFYDSSPPPLPVKNRLALIQTFLI